jgi:hypothetical protein
VVVLQSAPPAGGWAELLGEEEEVGGAAVGQEQAKHTGHSSLSGIRVGACLCSGTVLTTTVVAGRVDSVTAVVVVVVVVDAKKRRKIQNYQGFI